jgi:hypothetical protein
MFKIILPYFKHQFNFCKFSVGLKSLDFQISYLFVFISIHPSPHKCFQSYPPMPKQMLIFSMNGVMCYFP